jgi:hypothetical protein
VGVDEQPADVRVEEAPQRTAPADAVVDVRAVRVALLVGERMVLTVVGDPGDDRALDRGRAEDGQRGLHGRLGLEAAVGEEAVEADGHAEPGGQVGDHEDDDVVKVQPALPRLPRRDTEADDRQHRDRAGGDAVAGLVRDGLDILRPWPYGVLLNRRGHPFPLFWSP